MGKLADRAKELSPFITLDDGESIVGKYLDWSEVVSTFDPEKKLFQYEIEINGMKKYWKSGNKKVALFFDGLKTDSFVKITRTGLDRDTRYLVEESMDETGDLTREEADQMNKEAAE